MTGPEHTPQTETRHASAVAIDGAGVLITGPSGSGKSGLAIQLIALGAVLIADDRTRLALREGWPWLLPPERLAGVVEARGVGLLSTAAAKPAPLRLIVDMGTAESTRLPPPHEEIVLGQPIDLVRRVDAPYFPGAIVAAAKGGLWRDG